MHDDKPQPLKLTDDEWQNLFDDAGFSSGQHTSIIKRMLEPSSEDEYKRTRGKIEAHILYINNLDISLDWNGGEEACSQMKGYCGPLGATLLGFYYPVNFKREYTNEVFMKSQKLEDSEFRRFEDIFD